MPTEEDQRRAAEEAAARAEAERAEAARAEAAAEEERRKDAAALTMALTDKATIEQLSSSGYQAQTNRGKRG